MAGVLDLGSLFVHLKLDGAQFNRAINQAETRMKEMAHKMGTLGRNMTMKLTLPLTLMGGAATKAFASFDEAMTRSLAIMNEVGPVMGRTMEELALSMAREGVTSATDLAKSYFYLASAGLSAEQSMAALGTVEAFAVAGAFDMAQATDLLTDAQSALGLTVKDAHQNMINMTRVGDVLVKANTLANATTEQFSKALTSQAGPAMKAYGVSLEDGVAVLAAYADQGIKAERAGNLFGRMLRLTTKGFLDNTEAWQSFGLNIFDAQGELKDMHVIVEDLSGVIGEMSTQQRILTLDLLGFQARSQQAILPLIGLGDRIKDYREEMIAAGGTMDTVKERQLKAFTSQMKIFKNNVVEAGIALGSALAPVLVAVTGYMKKLLQSWTNASSALQKWVAGLGLLLAAIGPVLWVLSGLIKLLISIKTAFIFIKTAAWGATKAVVAFATASAWATAAASVLILVAALVSVKLRADSATAAMKNMIEQHSRSVTVELVSLGGRINRSRGNLEQTDEGRDLQKRIDQRMDTVRKMEKRLVAQQENFASKGFWWRARNAKEVNRQLEIQTMNMNSLLMQIELMQNKADALSKEIEAGSVSTQQRLLEEKGQGIIDAAKERLKAITKVEKTDIEQFEEYREQLLKVQKQLGPTAGRAMNPLVQELEHMGSVVKKNTWTKDLVSIFEDMESSGKMTEQQLTQIGERFTWLKDVMPTFEIQELSDRFRSLRADILVGQWSKMQDFLATPLERFKDQIGEVREQLDILYKEGIIDQDEFNKGLDRANEMLEEFEGSRENKMFGGGQGKGFEVVRSSLISQSALTQGTVEDSLKGLLGEGKKQTDLLRQLAKTKPIF